MPSRFGWMLWFSITALLAGGCSGNGEQSDATQGSPAAGGGGIAAANGAGPQVAGANGPEGVGSRAAGSSAPTLTTMTAGSGGSQTAGAPSQPSAAGAAAGIGTAGADGQAGPFAAGGSGGLAGAAATGSSGAGGATGVADPGLPTGATNFTAVCAGGKVGMDSAAAGKIAGLDGEFAGVKYLARTPNQIVSFKTTLVVPKTPTVQNVLFIWPGLQNRDGAADPARIGNGVLQPVLTWGPACAPKIPPMPYQTGWWISGQYVNVTTGAAGPTGCAGGDYLTGALGDWLEIDIFLKDDKWVQTIKDVQMNMSVDFTIDLKGQVQNEAMWIIEVPSGQRARPAEDTVWLQNVLTFSQPVTSCQPNQKGSADSFSAPTLSTDGLHCCWDKIVLKGS